MVSEKASDSVSFKFGIEKSFGLGFVQILGILGEVSVSKLLGFGIGKIWYRKKFRIRFRSSVWVSSHTGTCVYVMYVGLTYASLCIVLPSPLWEGNQLAGKSGSGPGSQVAKKRIQINVL